LSESAWEAVRRSRKVIDQIIESGKIVYGINTGFGNFANVIISKENLARLQLNLIRSHATCVGAPLSLPLTRKMFALRINTLAKGCSGISE
jgi:histidine ammonia-lyase